MEYIENMLYSKVYWTFIKLKINLFIRKATGTILNLIIKPIEKKAVSQKRKLSKHVSFRFKPNSRIRSQTWPTFQVNFIDT